MTFHDPSATQSLADSVTVRFLNELNDHLTAQRLLYRASLQAKLDKVASLFLAGIGVVTAIQFGVGWLTLLIFLLAVAEWFDVLGPGRIRTLLDFRGNPKYRDEYRLTFTPSHIHFQTDAIQSVIQWTHYQSALESRTMFLLRYGKRNFTLVPKRGFASESDMATFRTLLHGRVGDFREIKG